MKIHLHVEKEQQQIEIHIYTPEYNETIVQLMKKINSVPNDSIIGYMDSDIHLLKSNEVYSIYTEDAKVFLQTDEEEFECKLKLYELEERYNNNFIRVNKSMLVNIEKIASIQSKVLGNPQLILTNGSNVVVSRKYFKLLKEKLGLGRDSE